MTTAPTAGTRRRRKPWTLRLFVISFVLGALAFLSMVAGIVGLASGGTQEEDLQRVPVPGDATFLVDEPGTFTIFYESSRYRDEGVCVRTTTGVDDRPDLRCDEQLLRDAAAPPVVRPEGGDSLPVVDPGATAAGFDLDQHLPVWAFVADEAGTYEIELEDPPLGTESIAVGPDGPGAPAWTALAFLAMVLFGVGGLATLISAVILALLRSGQKRRDRAAGGGPMPPPPPVAWAPPAGPAAR